MNAAQKDFQLEQERDQARQDLHDTLAEVGAKLESVEDSLRPIQLVEHHAIGATLIAGALGFIFGSTNKTPIAGAVITAALVGFALSRRAAADGDKADVGTDPLDQR